MKHWIENRSKAIAAFLPMLSAFLIRAFGVELDVPLLLAGLTLLVPGIVYYSPPNRG